MIVIKTNDLMLINGAASCSGISIKLNGGDFVLCLGIME